MNFDKPTISELVKEIVELREEVIQLRAQLPNTAVNKATLVEEKEHHILPEKEVLDNMLEAASEEDLHKYLQGINDKLFVMGFISIHNLAGDYLYLSKNFEALTGYKRQEIIGKNGYVLMNQQDQEKVERLAHTQNIKGKDTVTNWRIKHSKGHFIWMETFSYIILDEHEKPAYIYCLSRNVTDKLAVEKKLEQKRKMYNSLFHSSPDALFLLDVNTYEINDCNKRALQLFKYNSKIDFFGKHFSELQQKELSFEEVCRINKLIQGKKTWNAEVRCIDSNGNFFESEMAMRVGENPDAPFILLRVTDLTSLKNTQSLLHKQGQLIASISENVNEGIYRSTLGGKLIYANKAFAKMFGYQSVNKVLKAKVINLYASVEQRNKLVDKIHKYGILNNEEVLFKNKKGENFWGLLNSKLNKAESGEYYFDGAIKDVTESKNYQDKLEFQNQELKDVNNALDRFVYSASHDLRAPIASSLGLIDIALRENDVDIIKEYLKLQATSLKKLDNFIGDIIDFSRNSRLEVQYEEVDFTTTIKTAFETYDYMENASVITRDIHIEQQTTFKTDKNRLNIILNNLLSNAIKYANPFQEKPFIKVKIETREESASIIIEDNGIGIPEEHIEKVFDMFYRAHPEKKGSGLGLFIVKEALEKLKGEIKICSKEGKGSAFSIELPNLAKSVLVEQKV